MGREDKNFNLSQNENSREISYFYKGAIEIKYDGNTKTQNKTKHNNNNNNNNNNNDNSQTQTLSPLTDVVDTSVPHPSHSQS